MQLAEVKVNRIPEALLIPEASGSVLEHFDPAVDAFSLAVVSFEHDSIENTPQMLFPLEARIPLPQSVRLR